ncbi:Hypothetical_protein [Hexamita inflata]|uniref:Hypothetical_protein n=1 Tax=Hexamita inflata TaxID=28002 RepID=A0AA86PW10_9EUKA|nr:Hypothetical protein HINF_LOCUS34671 [Hexamita inflata]
MIQINAEAQPENEKKKTEVSKKAEPTKNIEEKAPDKTKLKDAQKQKEKSPQSKSHQIKRLPRNQEFAKSNKLRRTTGGDISEMEIYNYEFYKLLLLCYLETIQKKWSQYQRWIIYCNLQNLQEYKFIIIITFQHIQTIIRFTTINAKQRHQLSQGE